MGGTMMDKKRTITIVRPIAVSVLVLVLAGAAAAQESDPMGYALLIQQSPPDAGFVTPGDGVHKFGMGESIALSAVPKPGYRFLYWLGDVTSVSASDTSVKLDSPKLVIAVFERDSFEDQLPQAGIMKGQIGPGGGLRGTPNPLTGTAAVSSGSPIPRQRFNFPTTPDFPDTPDKPDDPFDDDDVPVPGGDFPVPGSEVPEPATLLLLGLGAVSLLRRK